MGPSLQFFRMRKYYRREETRLESKIYEYLKKVHSRINHFFN
jgi:hypothetical protein